MGGCASLNKNNIHPASKKRIHSQNGKWKLNQNKEITSSDKLIMHHLDKLHSEVNDVVEEFEILQDNFNHRLESILEANQIYNQFYSKLKLLKALLKENNIQQLEKIIEIVHKVQLRLPKVMEKLSFLKEKLRNEDISETNLKSIQRRYVILYKMDEVNFDQFDQQIQEWDSILKKHIKITYEDIKTKKRMSNDTQFQPIQSQQLSHRPYKQSLLGSSNRPSKQNIMNSQVVLITANQTQSTLNQSQYCL